jgi:putative transposase
MKFGFIAKHRGIWPAGRSFAAAAPNLRWIADFTYVWTAEGWLYVAAVIDLFSRRVVGWSMSAAMTAHAAVGVMQQRIGPAASPDRHHQRIGDELVPHEAGKMQQHREARCTLDQRTDR